MTLKAGKGTRGGGAGWGHRVGGRAYMFLPPPQPKILYETLLSVLKASEEVLINWRKLAKHIFSVVASF